MRALVLRDYGELVVDTLADPVAMEDEVLIRIIATGICGSDVHGYSGDSGRRKPGQIMGHETVGRSRLWGRKYHPGSAPARSLPSTR